MTAGPDDKALITLEDGSPLLIERPPERERNRPDHVQILRAVAAIIEGAKLLEGILIVHRPNRPKKFV